MKRRRPAPETYAEVVRKSNACGFARLLGMEVAEVADGCASVVMRADGMENVHGTVHGGAIFALADHAFGIAANLEGVDQMAISAHIHYFSPPAAGTVLEAVARRVSETEKTSVYVVDVYAGDRHVASFEGIGFKTGRVEG
ncbi:MAG TPA: hotdog fold thioesterase [Candidatus Methanoculleus thermohydrogenotrophicum]|jgi:acyl-CoA thioesterase|nr:hotdog fold thioesterase [Candidatus Methanoculleus thermohydrogenotrophicum]NLM82885.1 hotdog fold thioesterase [Candidatus Methanoculleus thermohydrogenotrophicum]HOB17891.1 hotdog fold thioesterase [Candidatus Methanoculleus thermohydrogenotrophicum]HPZ38026.1 hotdog fold thioesterase [Candidatus Methanoculleus thermohydrogenotrophicum]HQC91278.1 hotdog fold thioesterase [Candidatus Methanoculleus thermohydrogenotrophicum]